MSEAIVHLYWLGESCFVMQAKGLTILTDPFNGSFGYEVKSIPAVDLVTVSHEHGGHNNVAMAAGKPLVLRGLTVGGAEFGKIDQKVRNAVRVFTVRSYHHEVGGSRRGKNAIFVFDILSSNPPTRLVHMGDFGEKRLVDDRLGVLKPVDVLLLPVGGYYTIGAVEAKKVVAALKPKIVVPMHWKTERVPAEYPTSDVRPFLEGRQDMILNDVASGNHLAVTADLLDRACEAGEPLIVPLDYGPPPIAAA
jgi:L-ascorbate metabolism protein UlaG (beta-lactamase superfamily)